MKYKVNYIGLIVVKWTLTVLYIMRRIRSLKESSWFKCWRVCQTDTHYVRRVVSIWFCVCTGELGYDGPLYDEFLHMTDDMLGPSPIHIKYSSYVYDGFCI